MRDSMALARRAVARARLAGELPPFGSGKPHRFFSVGVGVLPGEVEHATGARRGAVERLFDG